MNKCIVCSGEKIEVSGVPETIKILPLGYVKSQKGNFNVDKESYDLMLSKMKARGIDIVVDYEHQTLDGKEAPAGGWITELKLTDDAIEAVVQWTARAKEYLANKEYRYLSPVVLVRKKDNKAIVLHSVALTNTPAIDGMYPIINSIDLDYEGGNGQMELLKGLAKLLGLDENISEGDLLAEVGKLKDGSASEGEMVANKTICELLGVQETANTEEVAAAIVALKAPASGLEAEFKALKEKFKQREADEAVMVALNSGKVSPAMKDWATQYALNDLAGFKKFVEICPAAVPVGEIEYDTKALKTDTLDDATLKVCKMMGVSANDVKTHLKKEEN